MRQKITPGSSDIFLRSSGLFLGALFASYFLGVERDGEMLLSSELIHFIAGSLLTSVGIIVDRYFKSGTQKDTEKDLTYLVES